MQRPERFVLRAALPTAHGGCGRRRGAAILPRRGAPNAAVLGHQPATICRLIDNCITASELRPPRALNSPQSTARPARPGGTLTFAWPGRYNAKSNLAGCRGRQAPPSDRRVTRRGFRVTRGPEVVTANRRLVTGARLGVTDARPAMPRAADRKARSCPFAHLRCPGPTAAERASPASPVRRVSHAAALVLSVVAPHLDGRDEQNRRQ